MDARIFTSEVTYNLPRHVENALLAQALFLSFWVFWSRYRKHLFLCGRRRGYSPEQF